MTTICLNMIVKNERHVLERCLLSVKPYIHAWVIVDTGSTDGTQELIRKMLGCLPGRLIERPWVHFAHNRNEALQLATGRSDYLLFLDADEELQVDRWPQLCSDCYFASIKQDNQTSFSRILLVKDGLDWFWQGVLHESVKSPKVKTIETLKQVSVRAYAQGARSKNPKTYEQDAAILERALQDNPSDGRNTLYLALYYEAAKKDERALEMYQRRAAMKGDEEEVFYALYRSAILQERRGAPIDVVIESFMAAYLARPQRKEPLYWLIESCKKHKIYSLAYYLAQQLGDSPPPQEQWYVEEDLYHYGFASQRMHTAALVQSFLECKQACEELLKNPYLSEEKQELVRQNLRNLEFK